MHLESTNEQHMNYNPRTNWAGNLAYGATRYLEPETVAEVCELVRALPAVKALGTRHSFSNVADTEGAHISLRNLQRSILINRDEMIVTVSGGLSYATVAEVLHASRLALENMASLPHISVVGACMTGTHGSGVRNGNLATAVTGLEMVTADGKLVTFTQQEDPERFHGAVVSLGALGVVTSLTLHVVPTYEVQQRVFNNLTLGQLSAAFHDIMRLGHSVSFFTNWQDVDHNQLWVKRRVGLDERQAVRTLLDGSSPAKQHQHPIISHSPVSCTEQRNIPAPWHERLPHFKPEHTPSSGEELQSEFFIPRQAASEAIQALQKLGTIIAPVLQISEIRTVAADRLWLSPCYDRDSVALHFTWRKDWNAVRPVLEKVEAALEQFEARPHWAKLFVASPSAVAARYPRFADFVTLQQELDPQGKFVNSFLDAYRQLTGSHGGLRQAP